MTCYYWSTLSEDTADCRIGDVYDESWVRRLLPLARKGLERGDGLATGDRETAHVVNINGGRSGVSRCGIREHVLTIGLVR